MVLLTDGGGVVPAAVVPVVGADKVANVTANLITDLVISLEQAQVNGHPGLVLRRHGSIDSVIAVRVERELFAGIYAVRNPEKLAGLRRMAAVRRREETFDDSGYRLTVLVRR